MRPCLPLDTICNARDLGGLAGANGRQVRHGRLYRSANPALASVADLDRLHALGLDIVVDFRAADEKSAQERAFAERFRWIPVPVLEGNMAMDTVLQHLRDKSPAHVEAFLLNVYREFPLRYADAFGDFLRHAEQGATLLYHCTAGKDRTGFASLLLLSALGVAQDDILANYLESNHWNRAFNEALLARAARAGVRAEVMMPLLEVRADYLAASLDTIERAHGSVARYVGDALGVDVSRLRAHYLEP